MIAALFNKVQPNENDIDLTPLLAIKNNQGDTVTHVAVRNHHMESSVGNISLNLYKKDMPVRRLMHNNMLMLKVLL